MCCCGSRLVAGGWRQAAGALHAPGGRRAAGGGRLVATMVSWVLLTPRDRPKGAARTLLCPVARYSQVVVESEMISYYDVSGARA